MRTFVDLRISGDGLDLDEITEKLGMAPDVSFKKGDVHIDTKFGSKATVYQEDCWITGYEYSGEAIFEETLDSFMAKINLSASYIKSLSEMHKITVWISAYPDSEQANIHLSKNSIEIINEIGATLDCSMAFLKEFYEGNY